MDTDGEEGRHHGGAEAVQAQVETEPSARLPSPAAAAAAQMGCLKFLPAKRAWSPSSSSILEEEEEEEFSPGPECAPCFRSVRLPEQLVVLGQALGPARSAGLDLGKQEREFRLSSGGAGPLTALLRGRGTATCPVHRPTTRSAMKVSSVSPERWLTITPQPLLWAILHLEGRQRRGLLAAGRRHREAPPSALTPAGTR